MALGEIVRVFGAADYKAELNFYDRLNRAAAHQEPDFEHWSTSRLAAGLHDPGRRESLGLAHRRTHFEVANPEDLNAKILKSASRVRRALTDLRKSTLTRMGLNLVVFVDVGLAFEELKDQLRPLCLGRHEELARVTSGNVADIALHYDYVRDEGKGALRVGPMERKQGLDRINGIGEITRLFPPPQESDALQVFYGTVPDSFLYFDLDLYREGEVPSDSWPAFVKEAASHAISVFEGIKALVLETT